MDKPWESPREIKLPDGCHSLRIHSVVNTALDETVVEYRVHRATVPVRRYFTWRRRLRWWWLWTFHRKKMEATRDYFIKRAGGG